MPSPKQQEKKHEQQSNLHSPDYPAVHLLGIRGLRMGEVLRMNKEDIIRMAQEIAAQYSKAERFQTWTHDYMMQRLMELVEAEREACANAVENYCGAWDDQGYALANTIRARGQA